MSDAKKMSGLSWLGPGTGTSVAAFALDDSAEAVAYLFQAETSNAVTDLGFRVNARLGTPPTFVISIEGVDSSGNPDGVAIVSQTFTPPADNTWNGTWRWITLGSSWTPTKGQIYAIVIRYSSGTINASNGMQFTTTLQPVSSGIVGLPYRATYTAGAWTKVSNSGVGPFGYKTASGVFGLPAQSVYTTTVATSGHRQAAAINLPVDFGTTFKVAGIRGYFRSPNAGQSYKICVWDSSGTELATTGTLDADAMGSIGGEASSTGIFTTTPTLNFGTEYYYGIESVSSSTVGIRGITLASAADRAAYPQGENRCLATWNGSSWTKDTTTLPILDLLFDDVTVPTGGGGAIILGGFGQTGVGSF